MNASLSLIASLAAAITCSVWAQTGEPLAKNMSGRWIFLGKRTNSDVMSVALEGDGAPGAITGRLTLRGSNCGALDEPFKGTWDGVELRFSALLRSNVNARRANMECAADATQFVLTRKPGQAALEGNASASTGTFQVTLAP